MANRIVLDSNGIQALLKSEEMQEVLKGVAVGVSERAGQGFVVSQAYIGKTRANVEVVADTEEAKRRNLKDNTLLKAL